ncbi:hypothetical protein RclHR1_43670001 [Rhizophagus clarus]|uniref:DUF659 domain-containing protein n=1 Tax=Rhizophagus clarus TaxID=94130 RepID=A0A2Z6SBB0_9GLOM|nr:hypothetical protein RclHR1_43670001 [Rhizophagus clarus]
MAHCINLIIKDVCKHTFVADTVRKVGVIHQYFTMSHAPCQFLKDAIKILQIKGRGLKSHTKTRWSTMWDCINSIVRLEFAFARVTVGCLESRTSSLADCYIHLLSLASAVYRMPN